MKLNKIIFAFTPLFLVIPTAQAASEGPDKLLNVSYDVARDFYKKYNELFIEEYAAKHDGKKIRVDQSHGASSKQALSVANGLNADVVSMNQISDVNLLEQKGLVAKDWDKALPNHAVPYTSTMVILVRKGNPQNIKDWEDLAKDGVKTVIVNPKSSGNGRYSFLALYGSALEKFDNDKEKTTAFLKKVFKNIPVRASGGRAATTTFVRNRVGDALITLENEAQLAKNEFGNNQFEVVYPSYSIKVESPVAVVDSVTKKQGSEKLAKEYLQYLWSEPAQEIAASVYLRPSVESVLKKHRDTFPEVEMHRPTDVFGPWTKIMSTIFDDGQYYDQVSQDR